MVQIQAMPPLLIAIEGLDGAGTTTLARTLGERLEKSGRACRLTAEPSRGPIGLMIRRALTGEIELDEPALALLFAADRLDHLDREIEPALRRDFLVITDRYNWSSLAYQSIALAPDWVAAINRQARPADLTLLLDASVETCLARMGSRGGTAERYEKKAILGKVRAGYLALAQQAAGAGQAVTIIDAEQSPEQVTAQAEAAVSALLTLNQ